MKTFGYSGTGGRASSTKYTPPKPTASKSNPLVDHSTQSAKRDASTRVSGGDSGGTVGRMGGASS